MTALGEQFFSQSCIQCVGAQNPSGGGRIGDRESGSVGVSRTVSGPGVQQLGGQSPAATPPSPNFLNFPFRGRGCRPLAAALVFRARTKGSRASPSLPQVNCPPSREIFPGSPPLGRLGPLQTSRFRLLAGTRGRLSIPALGVGGGEGSPSGPPASRHGHSLTRLGNLRRDRAGDARPQDDVQRPQAPEQPPTHGSPRRSS